MKVVIRYVEVLDSWFICHAASYQNAYRACANGFTSRQQGAEAAKRRGCIVEFHEHDQLQQFEGATA